MATVLPMRPNTNSTGTSNSTASNYPQHRRPSRASFPSSAGSTSTSTQDDSHPPRLPVSRHARTDSSTSATSASASADHSSARYGSRAATRAPTRAVRSQYPANSEEKHVEYILVASFDIDRGSVMEHQYPGPVGGDEHMLAELMLPDQAHVRAQDWTIFFLHKDAAGEDNERPRRRRKRRKVARGEDVDDTEAGADEGGAGEWSEADGEEDDVEEDETAESEVSNLDGPPLVYVLNLVNTKTDTSVKRGAIVKAMAICTRHSFLHIYKPLLLLALQEYFANPVIETLASLYEAVNSMDLSLMPRLTLLEKFILQSSDAKDLFLERFEAINAQRLANKDSYPGDALPSRGRYGVPRDTHEFESVVHYSNVPVPVKIPVALSVETVGDFSLIKLITAFSTPHASSPVPFNPTHPHLTTSGTLTHPIIVLLNALLTQKRVIFLGHNLPSSEVAEAVLGACALASGGLLRGFTRHAFPYTDLTKIDDLLKVPGFIAGVTNPAFAHKSEWWDLLCDLSTGRMRISNRIEQAPLTEGVAFFQHASNHLPGTMAGPGGGISAIAAAGASLSAGLGGNTVPTGSMAGDATGDGAFMNAVIMAINERHGENAIRSKFRRWVLKFTRLAASFEEMVYGASALCIHPNSGASPKVGLEEPMSPSAKTNDLPPEVTGHGYVWATAQSRTNELAANATRVEGWRNTRTYYNFVQDLAAYYVHRPVKALDLQHLHDRLARLRLAPQASADIYLAICAAVRDETAITQLLSVVVNGTWGNNVGAQTQGLFYMGTGLFHPKPEVRVAVAELLARVQEHEAGRHFWGQLGRFVRVAWERVWREQVVKETGGFGEEDRVHHTNSAPAQTIHEEI